MKIQSILNEAPNIQGPNHRPFTGGNFQNHGSVQGGNSGGPKGGSSQSRQTKVPFARPPSNGPKVLMRGVGSVSDDIVGTTMTSRPRKSKSAAPELGYLYNEVVLPNLPQLAGHARRDDCLICTFSKSIAAGFGDVATLSVTNAETAYTWMYKDFNIINQTQYMLKVVQQLQRYIGLPTLDVPAMDERLKKDAKFATLVQSTTGTNGNITQYICSIFQEMIKDGRMGTATALDQIPSYAEEIWFRGSVQVTKIEHK